MKSVVCIFAFLLSVQFVANAQYGGKKLAVIGKGNTMVLSVTEEGSLNTFLGGSERIELDKNAREALADALQKALSWGVINNNQQLSFDKRVSKVGNTNIVFKGRSDGGHDIALYTSYSSLYGDTAFDIERPGSLFWTFSSDQQVREIITTLGKQASALDDIFK